MRHSVGIKLDLDPGSLVIDAVDGGKPRLLQPANTGIAFNLSHSRLDWVLALTSGFEIGVDLEPNDRGKQVQRIGEARYSLRERRNLKHQHDAAELRALQLWTLKEAVAKAGGRDLWYGLDRVRLAIEGSHIRWLAAPEEGAAAWSLSLGTLRRDHSVAIALRSEHGAAPRIHVQCHELGGDVVGSSELQITARST